MSYMRYIVFMLVYYSDSALLTSGPVRCTCAVTTDLSYALRALLFIQL
jgi:hypothetical protein